jgi:hypothetical protein
MWFDMFLDASQERLQIPLQRLSFTYDPKRALSSSTHRAEARACQPLLLHTELTAGASSASARCPKFVVFPCAAPRSPTTSVTPEDVSSSVTPSSTTRSWS